MTVPNLFDDVRNTVKTFVGAALTALIMATLSVVSAAPASAASACSMKLDPDRKEVYKFHRNGSTLGYGRIVVQATKAQRHLYCVRVQTGGNNAYLAFGEAGYDRVNGKWVYAGGLGDPGSRTTGYNSQMRVLDKTRTDRVYSIRHNGKWFNTINIVRYNL